MTGDPEAVDGAAMPDAVRLRRALWRASHRGTKEMDLMLGRFAEAHAPRMTVGELSRFEKLLELPDPDLSRWLLDPTPSADHEWAADIATIRRFHLLDT